MKENSIEEDIKIALDKFSDNKDSNSAVLIVEKFILGNYVLVGGRKNIVKDSLRYILSDYKRVLKENEILKEEKAQAWEEWNNLEQGSYETEQRLKRENETLKEYIAKAPNLDEITATEYKEIQEEAYIRGRAEEQQNTITKCNKLENENKKLRKERDTDYTTVYLAGVYDEREKQQKEIKEKNKIIDLMANEIANNITNTCPFEAYNYDLDCANRCNNNYKECWKQYFENKAKEIK